MVAIEGGVCVLGTNSGWSWKYYYLQLNNTVIVSGKEYNSCDKPEEKYDESEHIYTKFTEGSLVWAKISGWPW